MKMAYGLSTGAARHTGSIHRVAGRGGRSRFQAAVFSADHHPCDRLVHYNLWIDGRLGRQQNRLAIRSGYCSRPAARVGDRRDLPDVRTWVMLAGARRYRRLLWHRSVHY